MTLTPAGATPPADWYPVPEAPHTLRYWDGKAWTEHYAPAPTAAQPPQLQSGYSQQPQFNQPGYGPSHTTVIVNQKKGVNHVLHLILTIVTFGLWLPVWIILAIANS